MKKTLFLLALAFIVELAHAEIEPEFKSPAFLLGLKTYENTVNYRSLKDLMAPEEASQMTAGLRSMMASLIRKEPRLADIDDQLKWFGEHPYSVTRAAMLLAALGRLKSFMTVLTLTPNQTESQKAIMANILHTLNQDETRAISHVKILGLWTDEFNAGLNYPGGPEKFKEAMLRELKGR